MFKVCEVLASIYSLPKSKARVAVPEMAFRMRLPRRSLIGSS